MFIAGSVICSGGTPKSLHNCCQSAGEVEKLIPETGACSHNKNGWKHERIDEEDYNEDEAIYYSRTGSQPRPFPSR
jgi:hypothetical protein